MRAEVSVCIATYNGANYLAEQIESIVQQLDLNDEIVIVDDASTDNTLAIIKSFVDDRIRIYVNDCNCGHVLTFGRALSLASKDIILLSDQDDIWISGRVDHLLEELIESRCNLVSSNFDMVDGAGLPLVNQKRLKKADSRRALSNIIGIFSGNKPYYGCTMALRKRLLDVALPIPSFVESHDLWLALIVNITMTNCHSDTSTLVRRVHGKNLTPVKRRALLKIVFSRIKLLTCLVVIIFRLLFRFLSHSSK